MGTTNETATRYVGNCQICEGDQKVQEGRMVHHGYTRPGDGHTHGSCPGVAEAPYEVSCELLKHYLVGLRDKVANLAKRIDELRSGSVVEIYVEGYRRVDLKRKHEEPAATWARIVDNEVRSVEYRRRGYESEVRRVELRIARWATKPVRTFEEEKAKEDAGRAERKAAKDAARAARDAKRAATAAKQEALKARREAAKKDVEDRMTALAAAPKSDERTLAARAFRQELSSKKFSWLWLHELECGEAGVELGIARRETYDGHTRYYWF
jgi:hypothetical protein